MAWWHVEHVPANSACPAFACSSTVSAPAVAALAAVATAARFARCAIAEIRFVHFLAGVDRLHVRTLGLEDRERALVERAEDAVIDQHVAAGHFHVKLHHRGAAGGNQRGLHVLLEMRATLVPHLVEDLADDVEARDEVRTAVADVEAHALAGLRHQRLVAGQRAFTAVEQHVGRLLVDRVLHVERLQPLLAILARGVEVALHDVVLAVDLRQSLRRLDQDQAVHAVGDVHADGRRRAVIDVEACVERLEREARRVTGRREARRRAAARTRHAVQVDVVRHLRIRCVLEVELHRVALPHANEAAGHGAAERPERVADAFGDRHLLLDHFQLDDHLRRRRPAGRRAAPTAGS